METTRDDEVRYDDDEVEEIPNETTLHAMAQTEKIIEAWLKWKEA